MTPEEIFRDLLDGLSDSSKTWLHHACEQMADIGEYQKNDAARHECADAGLIQDYRNGRIEVHGGVMHLVYCNGYLKDYANK